MLSAPAFRSADNTYQSTLIIPDITKTSSNNGLLSSSSSLIIMTVLKVWMPSISKKHRSWASDRKQPLRREALVSYLKSIEILRIL